MPYTIDGILVGTVVLKTDTNSINEKVLLLLVLKVTYW